MQLSERNRAILDEYHAGKTCNEIGRKFGISGCRVSQIIGRAHYKMLRCDEDPLYELLDSCSDNEYIATLIYNVLKRNGINELEQILNLDVKDFAKFRNAGKKCTEVFQRAKLLVGGN